MLGQNSRTLFLRMNELAINTDSIVKQANKLIESAYRMEANEHKIILLAAKQVYHLEKQKIPFNSETEIIISAADYAKEYGVSRQLAFQVLSEAKNEIYDRSVEIEFVDAEGNVKPMSTRWIHMKGEEKAKSEISIFFAPAIIPFIHLIEKEFTLLDLKEVGRLKSKYAIRLYKLLMQWRNANYQPKFTYQDLRDKLGLVDEYELIAEFKKRVLDVAVKQINQGTGFVGLKHESIKQGTKITHFKFNYQYYDNDTVNITPVSEKRGKSGEIGKKGSETPKKKNTGKKTQSGANNENLELGFPHPDALSPAQAAMFAGKIRKKLEMKDARFASLQDLAEPQESYDSFEIRMREAFLAGEIEPYSEALKMVGFKPSKGDT
jgi:plasmid replication initiation protein